MIRSTRVALVWLGGSGGTPSLGSEVRPAAGAFVNVIPEGNLRNNNNNNNNNNYQHSNAANGGNGGAYSPASQQFFSPPEARHHQYYHQNKNLLQTGSSVLFSLNNNNVYNSRARRRGISKFDHYGLSPEIYEELLKLPLRYALHPFDKLQAHIQQYQNLHYTNNNNNNNNNNSVPAMYHPDYFVVSPTSASENNNNNNNNNNSQTDEADAFVNIVTSAIDNSKFPHEMATVGNSLDSMNKNNNTDSNNNNTNSNNGKEKAEKADEGEGEGGAFRYRVHGKHRSAVGVAPPLGPADALDVIPFHIHRLPSGRLPVRVQGLQAHTGLPAHRLRVGGGRTISGDPFRLRDELVKIFATRKVFTTAGGAVFVYGAGDDAARVVSHWLLGLGF